MHVSCLECDVHSSFELACALGQSNWIRRCINVTYNNNYSLLISSEYRFVYISCCQEFCRSNLYLLGSFCFIPFNPLPTQNDVQHEQSIRTGPVIDGRYFAVNMTFVAG